MKSEKCELAKEEKQQLGGRRETAETLLALVEESADERGLTANKTKNTNSQETLPPLPSTSTHLPLLLDEPSEMTVYEV